MAVLDGLPVGPLSAGALVAFAVLLIYTGRLVTRRTHEEQVAAMEQRVVDAQADRDYWRSAHDTQQQISLTHGMSLEKLLEKDETILRLLSAIQGGHSGESYL